MTKFKVALYGDSGVGKSSLLARLFRDVFVDSSQSTIGASFMTWRPTLASGKKIFIGIWDTAGQERFSSLQPMYLRGSHIIVYCIDYNDVFNYARAIAMYNRAKECSPNCLYYLVLTKIDMIGNDGKYTPKSDVETFAKEKGIDRVMYTSAKSGHGVKELFSDIAEQLTELEPDNKHTLDIEDTTQFTIKRKKCC